MSEGILTKPAIDALILMSVSTSPFRLCPMNRNSLVAQASSIVQRKSRASRGKARTSQAELAAGQTALAVSQRNVDDAIVEISRPRRKMPALRVAAGPEI